MLAVNTMDIGSMRFLCGQLWSAVVSSYLLLTDVKLLLSESTFQTYGCSTAHVRLLEHGFCFRSKLRDRSC